MSVDLSTTYLGLSLRSPLVAAASPLTGRLDRLIRFEDAGAAAVVLPSLFEEQVQADASLHSPHGGRAAAGGGVVSALDDYNAGPDAYLRLIEQARKTVHIPVIASINGSAPGAWVRFAQLIEQAGADALELNVYYLETDGAVSGAEVEQRYVDLVAQVRQAVRLPLAVKVGPYFTAPVHMAQRLVAAGAQGLVLFNRFLEPDIDLDTFAVVPSVTFSRSDDVRLPLRWIGILAGRIAASLAGSGGVHTPQDAIKLLLAGADVVACAAVALEQGPGCFAVLRQGLEQWMQRHGFTSISAVRGLASQRNAPDPLAYERANYARTIAGYAADLP
jgi:dihydroorotate dehydrogenase (fumarate)